jgi:hypothetical protein
MNLAASDADTVIVAATMPTSIMGLQLIFLGMLAMAF